LMDESILTGDARFLGKAESRIQSFIQQASALVLASHSLELTKRWCNKGLWLDQGRIRMSGPIEAVVEEYQRFASAR